MLNILQRRNVNCSNTAEKKKEKWSNRKNESSNVYVKWYNLMLGCQIPQVITGELQYDVNRVNVGPHWPSLLHIGPWLWQRK